MSQRMSVSEPADIGLCLSLPLADSTTMARDKEPTTCTFLMDKRGSDVLLQIEVDTWMLSVASIIDSWKLTGNTQRWTCSNKYTQARNHANGVLPKILSEFPQVSEPFLPYTTPIMESTQCPFFPQPQSLPYLLNGNLRVNVCLRCFPVPATIAPKETSHGKLDLGLEDTDNDCPWHRSCSKVKLACLNPRARSGLLLWIKHYWNTAVLTHYYGYTHARRATEQFWTKLYGNKTWSTYCLAFYEEFAIPYPKLSLKDFNKISENILLQLFIF